MTAGFASISAMKFGFAEVTPMVPICSMRVVIVPPAFATIWSTFAGSPFGLLKTTA